MRRIPGKLTAGAAAALVAALAGCGGGSDDYANRPRPATPINVTAAISEKKISISPKEFGAGPIVLIVSNQTSAEQTVTLETDEIGGDQPGIKESTRPIAPQSTGTLEANVREGTYAVSVSEGPEPVTVEVGPERASAQDKLLQP